MKNQSKYGSLFLVLISIFFFILGSQTVWAQEVKKNKPRINAEYFKIMNGDSYLDIKASARIDKTNVVISGIEIQISNVLEEGRSDLGKMITNSEGKGRFVFKDFNSIKTDSLNSYNILLTFGGNEFYKKASKSISFKDVAITASMIQKDSINFMKARLWNPVTDSAVVDLPLQIQVQRLFRPLLIGEEFNNTDDNGTIFVSIEEEIPGVDGNLIFEVVLNDSDDYGTVKALVRSNTGIPIVDESTFDERTMWSTRDKTPLFLLIFLNILIVATLGLIIYLFINLFKIYKAKI